MVPTYMKVDLVGCIGLDVEPVETKNGVFYSLVVAVKRNSPVLRPDGKTMDADWYKVTTNADCSKLKKGDYVAVEGRLVVKYWTTEQQPTKNYRTEYEVRADKVSFVEDDTKKKAGKMTPPAVGRILSSSLG